MTSPPDRVSDKLILACMDSGIGGLAVLDKVIAQMPKCPFVYLGDTAMMPYGEKPPQLIKDRVLSIFDWFQQQYRLAAFTLACNTATANTYNDFKSRELLFPVLDPISVTTRWVNHNINPNAKIGILATPTAVQTEFYPKHLHHPERVLQVPCRGLATAVESGWHLGLQTNTLLNPFITSLKTWRAEVVILACTHYSFLQKHLQTALGPEVTIIDSSTLLAETMVSTLSAMNLAPGPQDILVTGELDEFISVFNKLSLPALKNKVIQNCPLPQLLNQ